jgi:hypothetical protein
VPTLGVELRLANERALAALDEALVIRRPRERALALA